MCRKMAAVFWSIFQSTHTCFNNVATYLAVKVTITCKKNFLENAIELGMPLKQNATRYKQKTKIIFVNRTPTY